MVKQGLPGCGSTSVMTVTPDRKGTHPQNHLAGYSGVLQADVYGGYRALYESGRITEAACMAHARRKIHDVHARAPTNITTEANTSLIVSMITSNIY